MKRVFIICALALLLIGCNETTKKKQSFCLQGAWKLRKVEFPEGKTREYPTEEGSTYCRIYGQDSVFYQCQLTTTDRGIVIMPIEMSEVTLINKGNGEVLYLEDEDPHPLTLAGDTSLTIQQTGVLYSWIRDNDLYKDWGDDIRDIVTREMQNADNAYTHSYVLSAKERQQQKTIHWLVFIICLVMMGVIQYVIASHKSKQRLRLQLQQIQEEHEERSQHVRQAIMADEKRFFASDEYEALHKRIISGQQLTKQEWTDVEQMLKTVYPGFTIQLRGLLPMSELEYQTCLLIKLRIQPKDIASVLIRDMSTISTVRSRLYNKVFGKKGSTKDWDNFILSIGA